jgi:L-threonylcarbamoyladenylate synthase
LRVLDAKGEAVEEIAGQVAACVRDGGTVVLPTDTVYGIFCDAANDAAIERIYALKNRPRAKALGLYVDDVAAFLALAGSNGAARRLAEALLPGALTVIVERPARVSEAVSAGLPSVAVRVPDHALLRAILQQTGTLAGTSANLSGLPAFVGGAVPEDFPEADLFVDDGVTALGTESTVIDVSQARAHLIRAGAIPVAVLENVLGIEVL